jgi:hypothetical protein
VIRETGGSERTEYNVMQFDGNSTVRQQVIARCFASVEQVEGVPYSTVAVTPTNYRYARGMR